VLVVAAGLPLPAFFKSHLISFILDALRAITALAFTENLGGLVLLFLLGGWQSIAPGPSVFTFVVALLGLSLGLFLWGEILCFNTSTPKCVLSNYT
jgi:hypothetical protein